MYEQTELGWAISNAANAFQSSIVLKCGHIVIDAKSILGVFVSLQNQKSFELYVIGPDAYEAKQAMSDLFARYNLNFIIK